LRIVVLDGYPANPGDISWSALEALGDLSVYPQTTRERIIERACGAEVLITNKVCLDEQTLARLTSLNFISVLATGYDVVDVGAARALGISVSNVPEYSTQSVAQHVFTGLLALLNRPEQHHQSIIDGAWGRAGQFSFWNLTLSELAGKQMGIVGLGKIGLEVAKLANAFSMKVIATGRNLSRQRPAASFEIQWRELETLFSEADIVSLHCPATPATKKMINQSLISKMKPNSILINTARGALIDEFDLAEALNEGRLAGAFLDVVSVEPIDPANPLLHAKNCLLTPHIGWATLESRRRLIQTTADNVEAYLKGKLINVVN
jgi:glycerate dehydrogenase